MISAIIPHWSLNKELDVLLEHCVASINADEIIVVVNDGIGFGKAVNQGLRLAHGDYLLVVNNDTVVLAGDLADMCIPDTVTVPRMTGQVDDMPRAFYCMPRSVYDLVGGYDERFEMGYFEDDDFITRLSQYEIPVKKIDAVEVSHLGGTTMHLLDRDAIYKANKERFYDKWFRGDSPDGNEEKELV